MRPAWAGQGVRLGVSLSAGAILLMMSAVLGQATGIRKAGHWTVITYDKPDGRKDVAAIVAAPRAPFGLGLRCIDGNLSAALIPLRDEQLFGAARRMAVLSLRPDDQALTEMDGVVGDDHAILLKAPGPVLRLVLASRRLVVSAPAANGSTRSSSLDLSMSGAALDDLIKHCPGL